LYNLLTKGHTRVGNFPGVTVDILEGEVALSSGETRKIFDLPGVYTLASHDRESDEGIACAFLFGLKNEPGAAIVQVLDATQLEVGLELTKELLAFEVPLALVVTQIDLLDGRIPSAHVIENELDVPCIVVSARDPGCQSEVVKVLSLARVAKRDAASQLNPRELAQRALPERGEPSRSRVLTTRVDRVLLHPALGPIVFVALMSCLFAAVFLMADPVKAAIDASIVAAGRVIRARVSNPLAASFFEDAILGGVGTVLSFLPQIVLLTVALEILDETGYLARGAYLIDRLLRIFGLSGRAFVPLLMGNACAVPAIGATRILRDPKERLLVILVVPLMTCSARLPTYSLLIGAFFAHWSAFGRALLFIGLYAASIVTSMVASGVIGRLIRHRKSLPLVLEMPAYRVPQRAVVWRQASRSAKHFLRDVGTTILVASIALWVLLKVPAPGATAERPIERSIAASVGRAMEPVTAPLGFDWRINVGLIGSFGARELMVGTLGVILGVEDADAHPDTLAEQLRNAKGRDGKPAYSAPMIFALLAFFVIACQCVSTVASIRRETRSLRWPAFVLIYTYALAYVAAWVTLYVAKIVTGA
jgi:ferrous iron transport protein B